MENSQQIESTTSSNVKKNQLNSKQQKQLEDFKEYCLKQVYILRLMQIL